MMARNIEHLRKMIAPLRRLAGPSHSVTAAAAAAAADTPNATQAHMVPHSVIKRYSKHNIIGASVELTTI